MAVETWQLDTAHSSIAFTVRHLVIAKVRGTFSSYAGSLQVDGDDFANAKAEVKIDASSIDTQQKDRDNHLRSPDFFDVAQFPSITFVSKKIVKAGDGLKVTGDFTLHGVTRELTLDAEVLGRAKDLYGNPRIALSATAQLDRKDFGLGWNKALETGGFVVGDKIDIAIEAQVMKQAQEKAA